MFQKRTPEILFTKLHKFGWFTVKLLLVFPLSGMITPFFQIESSLKKLLKFCLGIHPKKRENILEKILY